MPLFLTEDDVTGLLSMSETIAALETAFRAAAEGEALNHARQRFFLPAGVLHHMAAALPAQGVMGTKTYASFGPKTHFYVQLFSADTGALLAYLEADRLGQLRTGAATGLAAKYLAAPQTAIGAILGTGFQAETQAEALVCTLPHLREVRVYSRDSHRRNQFCQDRTRALGIHFAPYESPEAAVRGAGVVVTATTAREPILEGDWLSKGAFVAAVGANRLTAREIDEDVVARAALVAVDDLEQAEQESAELLFAYERRKFLWKKAVPLAAVVVGRVPRPTEPGAVTLFKSLGVALEDVAAAAVVYQKAIERGVGRVL